MQENCAFLKKSAEIFGHVKKKQYLCTRFEKINGAIAQLVEQRTENPCVPGSIPGGTTKKTSGTLRSFFVYNSTTLYNTKQYDTTLHHAITNYRSCPQRLLAEIWHSSSE